MAEDNLPDDFDVIVLGTGRICSKMMVWINFDGKTV